MLSSGQEIPEIWKIDGRAWWYLTRDPCGDHEKSFERII